MKTLPELLSNSEQMLGPLTCHLQQNGIRLPTVDHTEGQAKRSEDTAALSAAWFHAATVLY